MFNFDPCPYYGGVSLVGGLTYFGVYIKNANDCYGSFIKWVLYVYVYSATQNGGSTETFCIHCHMIAGNEDYLGVVKEDPFSHSPTQ